MTSYVNQGILRHIRKVISAAMLVLVVCVMVTAPVAQASMALPHPGVETNLVVDSDTGAVVVYNGTGPRAEDLRQPTLKTIHVASTAYTSRIEECDADPFVTADGSDVGDGVVATNVLPFGTKIRLPTVFGDKIFTVHDRMNARYSYRVDIWMKDIKDARAYGLKRNIPIEVVEWGNNKTQWAARAEKMKRDRLAAKAARELALAIK